MSYSAFKNRRRQARSNWMVESSTGMSNRSRRARLSRNVSTKELIRREVRQAQELKYVDTAVNITCTNAGTDVMTCLNLIAQGVDTNQRVGNKIRIKGIQIQLVGCAVDVVTDWYMKTRMLIVWDNDPTSPAPIITDMMKSGSSNDFPLITARDRFQILRDIRITHGGQDLITLNLAMNPTHFGIDEYLKVNRVVKYKDTAANMASLSRGAIYICGLCTSGAGSGSKFLGNCRLAFTED